MVPLQMVMMAWPIKVLARVAAALLSTRSWHKLFSYRPPAERSCGSSARLRTATRMLWPPGLAEEPSS